MGDIKKRQVCLNIKKIVFCSMYLGVLIVESNLLIPPF
ncbi:hypothetical protein Pan97_43220 [Bremerella volcania]|uniref:Uncharacterized protein n=1 Tax=Bremerella volcania TaxID=2527984 RepID=A0A518CDF0_9BACT|nr:hypothetical protein Pan97_43220 [Bremerella volcania]